jgi:hypothetical protein
MGHHRIDLTTLKTAVNAVLDHLIEDVGTQTVEIEENQDFYWHSPIAELYDMSKPSSHPDVGRLSDDFDFVSLVNRGQAGDVSYNLVHIAPLLRYIGEKVKR